MNSVDVDSRNWYADDAKTPLIFFYSNDAVGDNIDVKLGK